MDRDHTHNRNNTFLPTDLTWIPLLIFNYSTMTRSVWGFMEHRTASFECILHLCVLMKHKVSKNFHHTNKDFHLSSTTLKRSLFFMFCLLLFCRFDWQNNKFYYFFAGLIGRITNFTTFLQVWFGRITNFTTFLQVWLAE